MRTVRSLAMAAALLAGGAASAQTLEAVQAVELIASTGNDLLAAHREATQLSIDAAVSALRAKDYAAARKHAQSVTRKDPKRVEAWLLLGEAQLGLQDWKRARTTYATAVRLSPMHAQARAGLGIALAKTGDPRATVQLAWLSEKAYACAGSCPRAAEFAKYKSDVEQALVPAPAPAGS